LCPSYAEIEVILQAYRELQEESGRGVTEGEVAQLVDKHFTFYPWLTHEDYPWLTHEEVLELIDLLSTEDEEKEADSKLSVASNETPGEPETESLAVASAATDTNNE
jgi:hypothetical protein